MFEKNHYDVLEPVDLTFWLADNRRQLLVQSNQDDAHNYGLHL